MAIYSFSQIGLYQQCPKKYQYKYVDGLETEFKTSPDLILGNSVHGTLEWLYQQVNIFNLPVEEQVLEKFHEIWDKEEKQAGEKMIWKGNQTKDDYLRRGEKYLMSYYQNHTPFDQAKLIGTEMNVTFSLKKEGNSEGKSFRGFIDRLDKEDDNFVINDYKTNKNLPDEDHTEYREQLSLYAVGVQEKYGKYLQHIKARIHYLHFGITDEWEITPELLSPIVEKYYTLIEEIDQAKAKYAESLMQDKTVFSYRENTFCPYCEYQMLCPLYKHLHFEDTMVDGGDLGETTIKKLIDHYTTLSQEISFKEKEKENLKELLIEYAKKYDLAQLFGSESSINIIKSVHYSAKDKEQFIQFLKEKGIFEQAADIPYYKINTLVKENGFSSEEIETYLDHKDIWSLRGKSKKAEK